MTGRRSLPSHSMRIGALVLLAALITGCASGPRYGAQRKRKKGCDCPHWNRVPQHREELRATTMTLNGPPPTAHGPHH